MAQAFNDKRNRHTDTHDSGSSLFRLLFGLILDFLVEEVSGNGVDDTVEEGKALNKLPDAEQFESKKESCHR